MIFYLELALFTKTKYRMLTTVPTDSTVPICYVVGGESDGVVVYVTDQIDARKGLPIRDFDVLDGKFQQLPNRNSRVLFIAGPAGSGKSTYTGKYVEEYIRDFPNTPLFLFSMVNGDVAFKNLNFTRILMDEDLVKEPLQANEFPDNCLIVMDDIDTCSDDKLQKSIYNLCAQVLEIGRHKNIQIIITSHLILGNNRKMSKTIMNELKSFTFFPHACSGQQLSYVLKTYFSCTSKQALAISKIESRWITILKQYPPLLLSEHEVMFLNKV